MQQMVDVLLRSGVITQDDIERVEVEEESDRELEEAAQVVAFQFEVALKRIKCRLGYEIEAWMRETNKLVPINVLEKWAELDERDQMIEWSKWLAAYREVTAAEN